MFLSTPSLGRRRRFASFSVNSKLEELLRPEDERSLRVRAGFSRPLEGRRFRRPFFIEAVALRGDRRIYNEAMARALTRDEISKLPPADRLDLIAELWDSLLPSDVPVPDSHRRAVDEALDDYHRDPNAGQSWDEVKSDLRRRK